MYLAYMSISEPNWQYSNHSTFQKTRNIKSIIEITASDIETIDIHIVGENLEGLEKLLYKTSTKYMYVYNDNNGDTVSVTTIFYKSEF